MTADFLCLAPRSGRPAPRCRTERPPCTGSRPVPPPPPLCAGPTRGTRPAPRRRPGPLSVVPSRGPRAGLRAGFRSVLPTGGTERRPFGRRRSPLSDPPSPPTPVVAASGQVAAGASGAASLTPRELGGAARAGGFPSAPATSPCTAPGQTARRRAAEPRFTRCSAQPPRLPPLPSLPPSLPPSPPRRGAAGGGGTRSRGEERGPRGSRRLRHRAAAKRRGAGLVVAAVAPRCSYRPALDGRRGCGERGAGCVPCGCWSPQGRPCEAWVFVSLTGFPSVSPVGKNGKKVKRGASGQQAEVAAGQGTFS